MPIVKINDLIHRCQVARGPVIRNEGTITGLYLDKVKVPLRGRTPGDRGADRPGQAGQHPQ